MNRTTIWWAALACLALAWSGCSTDAPANGEPNSGEGCTSTCLQGETRCYDGESVQECVENAEGCFVFEGEPLTCPRGQICQAGSCKRQDQVTCTDECSTITPTQCSSPTEVQSCADHDDDGCLEYGGATACAAGQFCDDSLGQCATVECQDACTEGDTRCEGGLLQTCRTNPQGCLAFFGGKECGEGMMCMDGGCVEETNCTPECVDGEKVCAPEGGVRACADDDGDGCATFQAPTSCGASDECRGGECVTATNCQDACKAGEKACFGNQIATCEDSDGDGCTDFNDVGDCPGANESCSSQGGAVRCEAPPQMSVQVMINEVFYDRFGPELDDQGRTPNFIELFGTPGASLAGYELRLVNGSNGMDYKTYTLPTDAKLDGNGYALIVPSAASMLSPNYFLFVAPYNTNVYDLLEAYNNGTDTLQNGPDGVVLEDSQGTVVDAVGYGTFGANDVFTGEGMAADGVVQGRSIGRVPGAADTNTNSTDFLSYVPTPGLPNSDLVINELYVDQPGSDDSSETFVEIGPTTQFAQTLSLRGYKLRAVDGNDGMDYILDAAGLPGIPLDNLMTELVPASGSEAYVVVCHSDKVSAALLAACNAFWKGDDFQNGPDSLVLEYQGRQVDAVTYGSGATMAIGEGSPTPSPSAGKSLARWPLGSGHFKDTDDNSTDFNKVSPTPGRDNPLPGSQ